MNIMRTAFHFETAVLQDTAEGVAILDKSLSKQASAHNDSALSMGKGHQSKSPARIKRWSRALSGTCVRIRSPF